MENRPNVERSRHPRPLYLAAALLGLFLGGVPARAAVHTYGGTTDLSRINVTAVYFLPRERQPVPDWKERLTYMAHRMKSFHRREFDGQSEVVVHLPDVPLVSASTAAELQANESNPMFWKTVGEVREQLHWPPASQSGFPVLLVFSDINWRELDDFHRLRMVDGAPEHEGSVNHEGRHFPGAKSGGSRAAHLKAEGCGVALVSADGWRVPYTGSDCVAYHEGLGHVLGLPHPKPANGSVMSQAQYRYNINESWIDDDQKKKMGWEPVEKAPNRDGGLFTQFRAIHHPPVPKTGEDVRIDLSWPAPVTVAGLVVEIQTDLFGPWVRLPTSAMNPPPVSASLGAFSAATPVSYRVRVETTGGRAEEVWGYFQVRDPQARSFWYHYRHEPPGKRFWSTTDGKMWVERGPHGQSIFRTTGSATVNGRSGVTVLRIPDERLDVFIPDAGHKGTLQFRFAGETAWKALGAVNEHP